MKKSLEWMKLLVGNTEQDRVKEKEEENWETVKELLVYYVLFPYFETRLWTRNERICQMYKEDNKEEQILNSNIFKKGKYEAKMMMIARFKMEMKKKEIFIG